MKSTSHGIGVQTAVQLQRRNRRLNQRTLSAEAVFARMYEGQCLRFLFDRRLGPIWQLSPSGVQVSDAVARVVIADPDVVSTGDGLFADGPAQTWRMVE